MRKYPWGTAESLSGTHSDFACLKKLLFEVAYMDLKNATDERYYKYREGSLLHFDDPAMYKIPPPLFPTYLCCITLINKLAILVLVDAVLLLALQVTFNAP